MHIIVLFFRHGESLADTLTSFLELMEHAILTWDIVKPKFVKRVGIVGEEEKREGKERGWDVTHGRGFRGIGSESRGLKRMIKEESS